MHYSVGQIARRIGVAPHRITNLFYRQKLDNAICPIVSGRRIIPDEYVPVIEAFVAGHGGGS